MKIDWKYLSTTTGYKSLKAAYIRDVQKAAKYKHPMRNKDEFLRHFRWAIGRARHYAYKTGKSMETVLNAWEAKRTSWWLNYYQDCWQPLFRSGAKKPMGVNGIRNYYKKSRFRTKYVNDSVCDFIKNKQKTNSVKKKKRWSMAYKKRKQEMKRYL